MDERDGERCGGAFMVGKRGWQADALEGSLKGGDIVEGWHGKAERCGFCDAEVYGGVVAFGDGERNLLQG